MQMNNNKYLEVQTNLINNFFNPNYRYSCVMIKDSVITDINQRFPFPFKYNYDNDIMSVSLGNNINIDINFEWEFTDQKKFHLVKIL